MIKTLHEGSRGQQVRDWQHFLIGEGVLAGNADGIFGTHTADATRAFQKKRGLQVTGAVGNATLGAAMQRGLGVVHDAEDAGKASDQWPPKPDFNPLIGDAARQAVFGKFRFEALPARGKRVPIKITDGWDRENIVSVDVPQLAGLRPHTRVRVHRLVAKQFLALWQAWEDAGLLDRVVSFNGSFVPRLIVGGTSLSNHSFGTAFDINVKTNGLGKVPALVGQPGSVRELVPLAHKHGFYWGGHFRRRDGMHFEVAVVKR